MKDITEYLSRKNKYHELFGNEYAKSLKKDIRNSKLSKLLIGLAPTITLSLYWSVVLLINSDVSIGNFWMSVGMVCMQIPGMQSLARDIDRFRKSANMNLAELTKFLFRNNIETDVNKLKEGILTRDVKKEKIEYREVETNKKIINHEIKTIDTRLYFKDIDDQIRCLKEVRQEIIFQGEKEVEKTLQVFEMDEIPENEISQKVKIKLMELEKKQ